MKKVFIFYSILSFIGFGEISAQNKYTKTSDGIILNTAKGKVRVQVLDNDIIRITATPGNSFSAHKSLMVAAKQWKPVKWQLEEKPGAITLSTPKLKARIVRQTGEVSFYTPNNQLILSEKKGGGKTFVPAVVYGDTAFHVRQQFEPTDEAIYGLGSHQRGLMNYKDEQVDLFQDNTIAVVPFYVSTKGYGILWDNNSHTKFGSLKPAQIIPFEHLYQENGKNGLTATYFKKIDLSDPVLSKIDSTVNISQRYQLVEQMPDFSQNKYLSKNPIHPDIEIDSFSVRWTGEIKTMGAGEYRFLTKGDDGIRLWIDNKLIIDNWYPGVMDEVAKINLEGNRKYKIKVEWFNTLGPGWFDRKTPEWFNNLKAATMQLQWIPPLAPEEKYTSVWSELGDQIDYYFMYGPSMDQVVSNYRETTGKVPMFPKSAFGFWQSKEHYHTQKELISVTKEFRERQIPVDNMVQDWFYWHPFPWGSHKFDPERYPDPKGMIDTLHRLNTKVLISVWPLFHPGSENYNQLKEKGFLFTNDGPAYFDAFNKDARNMYWGFLNKQLFPLGIDGWWLDATEPEMSGSPIDPEFIKANMKNALGSGGRYLNAFSLMTTKGVYEGQRSASSDKRVSILTRSAFAGQQRYGAITWTGDVIGNWNVFKEQISAGLNFNLSGIPYWTTDIGGFFELYAGGNRNGLNEDLAGPSHPEYNELFTRWFQFGAFCPIFRVHGTYAPREMWKFGEQSYKIQLKYDQLRYRLMPYIYSLSGKITQDNYTLMRPLVMDFKTDKQVLNIDDQFMFGPSILVNPVTTYKASSRNVYLPQASGWYNFWTGEYLKSGQSIEADAPIQTMPLFVKAGSIIPMGSFIQYATEKPDGPLEIRIYRGADGHFTIYEDEGDNYNYEKGVFATIPLSWNDKEKTLTIGNRKGSYPGMPVKRTFRMVLVSTNKGTGLDVAGKADREIVYDGKLTRIKF